MKKLSYWLVRNPLVLVFGLLLLFASGYSSISKLPVQLLPDIEAPQIAVIDRWPGATPDIIESIIVEPQEQILKNLANLKTIETTIKAGKATINLTFNSGTDMSEAFDAVNTMVSQLPEVPRDAFEPVVKKKGSSSTLATLMLHTTEGNPSSDVANDYQNLIEESIVPLLSAISDVSHIDLVSKRNREVQIVFDPYKLAALNIRVDDVIKKLEESNDYSSGYVDIGRRHYAVEFKGQYAIKELGNLLISRDDGFPVYLHDIASVGIGLANKEVISNRDGRSSYFIRLHRVEGSDTVAALETVKSIVSGLNKGILSKHKLALVISYDTSTHIKNAINLLNSSLGLGVLLALTVIFLVLKNIRSTLIICASIPISLIFSLIALNALDRTLNVISLAGLAFSVGLVLDAAIIVQESVKRQLSTMVSEQELKFKLQAIVEGTWAVKNAILTSTITSVAIFIPILMTQGIESQLFSDLAITLSVSLLASAIVALLLMPILNYYFEQNQTNNIIKQKVWEFLSALVLTVTNSKMKRRVWSLVLLFAPLFAIWFLLLKPDFLPKVPLDGFYAILDLPQGTSKTHVEDTILPDITRRILNYQASNLEPKIDHFNVFYNEGDVGAYIYASNSSQVKELMKVAKTTIFKDLSNAQLHLSRGSMLKANSRATQSIDLTIQGSNFNQLIEAGIHAKDVISKSFPDLRIRSNPKLSVLEPKLSITPRDVALEQLGLSRSEVARATMAMSNGIVVNEYFDGNERLNVLLRSTQWISPEAFLTQPIFTSKAGVQLLEDLVVIERGFMPDKSLRYGGKRAVKLTLAIGDKMSLAEASAILEEQVIPKIKNSLPESYSVILSGNANDLKQSLLKISKYCLLAICILFMLLMLQFKSLLDSLLVLSSVPLAVAGGVIALATMNLVSHQNLDILTMIGFVILLGLVINNSILLIEQVRSEEKQGLPILDAINAALSVRIKPIVLSSLTSILGMLPLAIMPGAGAEIYRGLAIVILGGMIASLLFAPILYASLLTFLRKKHCEKALNQNQMEFNHEPV